MGNETERRDLRAILQSPAILEKLRAVLPEHLAPERQIQVALTAVFRTPRLRECEPLSVASAMIQAGELGLDINPSLGEAYLVPRYNKQARCLECTCRPGYRGLLKLARQSGEIRDIQADVVHQADTFRYGRDPLPYLVHEPLIGGPRGKVVAVYAIAYLMCGINSYAVLPVEEIERIRARSEAGNDGPWVTDWAEMAKKTALKRLCKTLPVSVALRNAVALDDTEYRSGPRVVVSSPPTTTRLPMACVDQLALEQADETQPPGELGDVHPLEIEHEEG